jgi:hypothetical protein
MSLRRRGAISFGLAWTLALACASRPPTAPRAPLRVDAGVETDANAADVTDAAPLASLDELAERGRVLAAGLDEVSRRETGSPARASFTGGERDICVRVVFASDEPVRVTLRDAAGAVLGDEATGREGAAPARGPACVRAGRRLEVVFEGNARVRYVIFASR